MKNTKPYYTRRDMLWKKRGWYTGMIRKLTDEEAKPLLEKELIYEVKPKRFVILDGKEMTWGEYLKRKKANSAI